MSLSPVVTNGPSTPKFVCKTHVLPPLLQFWRCAPEEDVLVQDQLDGGKDVEGVVHHQGLSYVPKIIRIELTSHFGIEKTRELVARKYYGDLQLLPIPTHCRKGTSYDSIFAMVDRLTEMIHDEPVPIKLIHSGLRRSL